MKCLNCNKSLATVDYLSHTVQHSDCIVCPLGCGKVFSSREYYLRQRGKCCSSGAARPEGAAGSNGPRLQSSAVSEDCAVDTVGGIPAVEGVDSDEEGECPLADEAGEDLVDFFAMLNNGNCSQKIQNLAALRLQGMFDSVRAATQRAAWKALKKIKDQLMQAASLELSTFVDEEGIVQEILSGATIYVPDDVKTQYRREKAFVGTGGRVPGHMVEVPATFDRPGRTTRKGFAQQYHRPVKKVLLEMAMSEEHLARWRDPFLQRDKPRWKNQTLERVHSSPLHGDRVSRLCAAAGTTKNIIFIELYSDDVTHTGGNRNSNDSTVGHSYFGVVNMAGPDSRRHEYWNTHHFCLPKDYEYKDAQKQYGLVIQDMKYLVANDLVLPSGERFKVRLVTLSGDQKELHIRMGLVSHFMAEYTDRYTYTTLQERINCKSSTALAAVYSRKRTQETTRQDLAVCEREKRPVRGHIRRPLLETVPQYDLFGPGGTSACVSHDLHTGINKYDLSLSLRCVILEGWTSLAELNQLITSFKDRLAGDDSDTYPGNITMALSGNTISIQGNMAQSKNLIRFMPLILKPIADRHPQLTTHPAWLVITGLADLNAGWASFAVSESQLQNLDQTYKTYLDRRYELVSVLLRLTKTTLEDNRKRQVFTDLKPKHGTLLSYPAITRELGAIAYFSTLPAEQKNGKLKGILQDGNNYKNIIKSLGKAANSRETVTPHYVPAVDSIVLLNGSALETSTKKLIARHCGGDDYTLCSKVSLNGIPHQRDQAVTYYANKECNAITVGIVQALLLYHNDDAMQVTLLTQRQAHEDVRKFRCYRLKPAGEIDFVKTEDLASHVPCNKIKMGTDLGDVISFAATPTILHAAPTSNGAIL